jgi:hypothetical protein
MSEDQPRDERGRWAGGSSSDHQARADGRYPVTSHLGSRSVASHPGSAVVEQDERGNTSIAKAGKRLAVAEHVAKYLRTDHADRSYKIR